MKSACIPVVPAVLFCGALYAALFAASPAGPAETRTLVSELVTSGYPSLLNIYSNLHAHPELSFMEVKTSAMVANELRGLGFTVTEKVGRTGVVGVLANGTGPTVLVRADMDALPVKENSGVSYASTDIVKDAQGKDQPAMHACAHDTHITGLIGAARLLASMKDRWAGTLVLVAQPAEEIVAGARALFADGLYTRFPKPDFAIALHTTASLPAGMVGYAPGPYYASVNSMDIVVRGFGGHGSAPHTTKDPVVLASQIVVALQTIVSRELKPGTPAVVTVGTIHGGLKRNIISDEVKLELTLRAFDKKVMEKLVTSIRRICEGTAKAAGLADDRLPVITLTPESAAVTVNDPALTRRLGDAFVQWFGKNGTIVDEPVMGAEDFGEFGRDGVPICMWRIGATAPERFVESDRTGIPVPSNHSATFAPVPEPTLKACVTSLTAAVLELLAPKP